MRFTGGLQPARDSAGVEIVGTGHRELESKSRGHGPRRNDSALKTERMTVASNADVASTDGARPITDTNALTWHDRRLPLPFKLGEWTLWTIHFRGVSAQPDPFGTAFDDPDPPQQAFAAYERQAAFMYSLPVTGPLPVLARRQQWLRYAVSQYPHYAVDVSGTFEDYWQRFRSKTRSTIRRKVRRVAETNEHCPAVCQYDSPDEMDEFLELALPVSRKSYQQRLFGMGLEETPAFREQLRDSARKGEITGFILFVHDQAAAYTLCPRTAPGRTLYDHTGYDPAFEGHSPGTVLQLSIIETMFADPTVQLYDLCTGGGRHKELFATDAQPCANIYFVRLASWPTVAIGAHYMVIRANRLIKRILERLNMRDRIKKAMRRSI